MAQKYKPRLFAEALLCLSEFERKFLQIFIL